MWKFKLAVFAATSCLAVGMAAAADFVNLDWGDFKLSYESAAKPKSVSTLDSNKEAGMTMTLDGFAAGADGSKIEGSSSISGEFIVQQSNRTKVPVMTLELKGTLIKTPGTTAEIVANIGPSEQRVSWPAEEAVAGQFIKTLPVLIPDGQLPVPFPVNVQAFVKRNPGAGAILLTLDSIAIRVGQPNVANLTGAPSLSDSRGLAALQLGLQDWYNQ